MHSRQKTPPRSGLPAADAGSVATIRPGGGQLRHAACSGGTVGSMQVHPTTSQYFAPGFLTTLRGSMSQAGASDVAVNGSGYPHY